MSASWSEQFYKLGDDLKEAARTSVKTVLKSRAERFFSELKAKTPRDTGGLAESLAIKELKPTKRHKSRIGYEVGFYGYDKHGKAYQIIANALNAGYIANNFKIIKTASYRFIATAHEALVGIDPEITEEWHKQLERISKHGD